MTHFSFIPTGQQHRIGSLTIERTPAPISVISSMNNHENNHQNLHSGPRNVTMNVMDMPSSLTGAGNQSQPSRKPLILPQDVQLISVGHTATIQAPKPPLRNTAVELSAQAVSISASVAASNMASPPNKTLAEAIKCRKSAFAAVRAMPIASGVGRSERRLKLSSVKNLCFWRGQGGGWAKFWRVAQLDKYDVAGTEEHGRHP